ncbi:MAG: right-handed parallel beta-helix repeat-containing protein, partial [Actinobacteria bacterium]|nr:right-handed parallel beta-helix repeat-containing protein [Actinomycetota bacterium]
LTENGGNVVEGCYVGTDPTGTLRRANSTGIIIATTQNRIGGPTPAQRNVISGNNGGGVGATTTAATGNVIQGNYIGTNAAGTLGLPNNVGVFGPLGHSLIGGVAPGEGNLISGNSGSGIEGGLNNTIQGNLIGTDVTGMKAVPNADRGIRLSGALAGNRIGGTEPGARNVISGNVGAGIGIEDGAAGTVVQGNYIGVAADGTSPLPNTTFTAGNSRGGVFVKYSSDNQIGGPESGRGNVIAYNGGGGVIVVPVSPDAPQQGISIRGNDIYSNDGLGIDLGGDGVTPNDAGDADAGANNRQNFPLVTSVTSDGLATAVGGTLNSKPSTTYEVDFYSNRACDPSGHGEGALAHIGVAEVTTDAAGNAAFQATLSVIVADGRAITLTATDPAGSTSEFSP